VRGIAPSLYGRMGDLPHFNPDDDVPGETLHPAVLDLRARLAASDAILFSTPEYAGALPGSFKNLLDWTVGGGETYGMPVAWINTAGAAAPARGANAEESLRKVLGYTASEIVELGQLGRIPVERDAIGKDGLIAEPTVREQLAGALRSLAAAVEAGRADRDRISATNY